VEEAPLLKLLVLTPKPKGLSPGQRFRLEQWAPRVLADHGIRMDFVPFESPRLTKILYERGRFVEKASLLLWDLARRARAVASARGYDAVVVYREAALVGPAFYERLIGWSGKPLLFDFDDSIWLPTTAPGANALFAKLHFFGKTATVCRLSKAVLVGNDFLADYARRHTERVFVVPTSIELEAYPLQPELPNEEPFVVCWSGSHSTRVNLETARGMLERFAQKQAKKRRVVVKVICNVPPERPFAGVENAFVPWTEHGEAEAIGQAHVGIMPLSDDDYSRGKCGLKALQYMATGRPVVAAAVGANCQIISHGKNGFLARTDDEWIDALDRLAASPALRSEIGLAGRRTVETGYCAKVVAATFANAVRATLSESAPTRGSRRPIERAPRRAIRSPLSSTDGKELP
jgi:glycosyltransferase involved in cell wall biosynthesis